VLIREEVVAEYKVNGINAGIEKLEKLYQSDPLQKTDYDTRQNFYTAVWKEAQLYSGKDDFEWGIAMYRWIMESSLDGKIMSGRRPFGSAV
jgi:hypothetical protein